MTMLLEVNVAKDFPEFSVRADGGCGLRNTRTRLLFMNQSLAANSL
jgi:hypothetical protein